MTAAVEFAGVHLQSGEGRPILDGISLAVEPGSVVALLGRSGSGKTTLLRTVNGLVRPTRGTVRVHGQDVAATPVVGLRRGIGYVIQETGLFPHLTVGRNIMMVPELAGAPTRDFPARVAALLASVGLDPASFAARYPHQLSGGQRQRVGLARALAADPPLLLMDEPFGALDPLTRAEMQDMLRTLLASLRASGHPKTVLLVTHDLDEAMYLADRVLLVDEGRIAADLPPAAFLADSSARVRAYVQAYHRGEQHALAGRPTSTGQASGQPAQSAATGATGEATAGSVA